MHQKSIQRIRRQLQYLTAPGSAFLRDKMALLFLAGYGDGVYSVFGKFDEAKRVVEVIIDMDST